MHTVLLCWTLALAPADAEVVDRVVVVVENQLVLASEVRLEAELQKIDASPSPFWNHGDPLTRLTRAAILRVVAGDVSLYQPDPDDVQTRVEAIRIRFPDFRSWRGFLDAHGIDEGSLAVFVRRRMVVERFLARNLQTDPSDVLAWMAEADAMLDQLRPRVRVRVIELEGIESCL